MCVWNAQISTVRASNSAICWNQAGSWVRITRSTSRDSNPPVPSAASTRSLNSGVGSLRAVSIWPTREPV